MNRAMYVGMGIGFRGQTTEGDVQEISVVFTLSEEGFRKVTKRGYRGISPEIDVEQYVCSECKRDYEQCSHRGVDLIPTKLEFVSASVVRRPRMGTKITDVLCVKTSDKRRSYRWIGYREGVRTREQRIAKMKNDGRISPNAAAFISSFFRSRQSGDCRCSEHL